MHDNAVAVLFLFWFTVAVGVLAVSSLVEALT